jgi:hypothetical protein
MNSDNIDANSSQMKVKGLLSQELDVVEKCNAETLKTTLLSSSSETLLCNYKDGVEIVSNGTCTIENPDYRYTEVPLGIILSGEVIVMKDGKATKLLKAGDFIGLFETSDWLQHNLRRHLGNWTLIAHADVEIMFLPTLVINNKLFSEYVIGLSRNDPVPQPNSDMPLLDWVATHTTHKPFAEYAIIAHTHLLPSNMPLSGCEVIPVKVQPGTPYSFAVQQSIQILWETVIEDYKRGLFSKLLILDDGGDIWLTIPFERLQGLAISGVEQTQRGTTRIESSTHHVPPVISVASSGVKKLVESDFIGRSVFLKLKEAGHMTSSTKIGVIGAGSIGNSVVETSTSLGFLTYVYDPLKKVGVSGVTNCPSLDNLLSTCDLIIGTTGTNSLRGVAFNRVSGNKKLASASSADIEFATLLRIAPDFSDTYGSILVPMREDLQFEILNGGFPFNFDRQGNASHEEDIVLTRALLYAGMMQAREVIDERAAGGLYDMDIETQRQLLEAWLIHKKEQNEPVKDEFTDVESVVNATFLVDGKKTPAIWK